MTKGRLLLEDGTAFAGELFGGAPGVGGEVVFNTGMVGYPEALTDPSYHRQILVFTQPMIGNYGVPAMEFDVHGLPVGFESGRIQAAGVVISDLSVGARHWRAKHSFEEWLCAGSVPGLTGVDTRACTKILREKGSIPGGIFAGGKAKLPPDPNLENLVAQVSVSEPVEYAGGRKRVVVLDCGVKANIVRSLLVRNVSVLRVPWDHDVASELAGGCHGLVISNGPGDPKMVEGATERLKAAMALGKPVFGICMGNQLLALAAGFDTYKMKFGHRSQNQPSVEAGSGRCLITSQNHGFAVNGKKPPKGWETWFTNANDGTVEGIRHREKPFFSVQFHPEATPGPVDSSYLFDMFVKELG